jgi:hypothetical protein
MTEFAYSGLGLNPHYGTPLNPFDREIGRIPGGSTSGGAVSVLMAWQPLLWVQTLVVRAEFQTTLRFSGV